jgi:hypothetical protein
MFSILVGENEVNTKLGRLKSKWDYNLDFKEWGEDEIEFICIKTGSNSCEYDS